MIAMLSGIISAKTKDGLVIETSGGVGYAVRVQKPEEKKLGESVRLYTYLKVSDQALDLYGFSTEAEQRFFELLLTVTGVGPKSAMTILSLGSIDDIQQAIARGDAEHLSSVQGIGKKTAERMVLELRSKVAEAAFTASSVTTAGMAAGEVIDALVGMGYDRGEARIIVQDLARDEKTTEELLREALRRLGR